MVLLTLAEALVNCELSWVTPVPSVSGTPDNLGSLEGDPEEICQQGGLSGSAFGKKTQTGMGEPDETEGEAEMPHSCSHRQG